jgi:multidrug efflux pump subunit AcrA (membrane-fusion protein)
MYAEASIHTGHVSSDITIPPSALHEHAYDEGRGSVWVLASDRVFPRDVAVEAASADGGYRVVSGLEHDEVIVVQNHSGLQPGERVQAVFETEED